MRQISNFITLHLKSKIAPDDSSSPPTEDGNSKSKSEKEVELKAVAPAERLSAAVTVARKSGNSGKTKSSNLK